MAIFSAAHSPARINPIKIHHPMVTTQIWAMNILLLLGVAGALAVSAIIVVIIIAAVSRRKQ
ncbi:hypothetical protein DSM3645_00315 [Blastopirellula marina DSM 3645]|uniref:Uncharacterized protein n=1 Tax=Blastopirellula marina DSM 3645 TaxID=314230 RepID=A3ZME2_9BACT|nr:hypothetical protein DSM3645_00315 [Blastopirellula marina DSM 3645]